MKTVKTPGKRLLSLLLALAVCLSCMGTAAMAAEDTRYKDVPEGAWYAEAAAYCYDMGLILGTGENIFSPQATMTRGMLVSILWRMELSPRPQSLLIFMDNMEMDAWYFQAVNWASENHIANGYGNGLFGVNDPVTREQFAAILFNFAVYKNPDLTPVEVLADGETESGLESRHYFVDPETKEEPVLDFRDEAAISEYARYAVGWVQNQRIMSGKPGRRFDPRGLTTRAEAAMIIRNYLLPFAQRPQPVPESEDPDDWTRFYIQVGDYAFDGVLSNTAAGAALRNMMPFTVDMRELGGNEKFYNLSEILPVDASVPGQIYAGELMLYRNNALVLFYRDITPEYRYTPLGRITNPEGLAEALDGDPVRVSFHLGSAPA